MLQEDFRRNGQARARSAAKGVLCMQAAKDFKNGIEVLFVYADPVVFYKVNGFFRGLGMALYTSNLDRPVRFVVILKRISYKILKDFGNANMVAYDCRQGPDFYIRAGFLDFNGMHADNIANDPVQVRFTDRQFRPSQTRIVQ